jgi:hypothetical protein
MVVSWLFCTLAMYVLAALECQSPAYHEPMHPHRSPAEYVPVPLDFSQ